MTQHFANRFLQLTAIFALLMAFSVVGPHASHAQIVFQMELSEKGQKAFDDPAQLDAKKLMTLLSKEGRIASQTSPKGERNVESREASQVHVIVGENGQMYGRADGEPFRTKAGSHPIEESFPHKRFLSILEESFPDTLFFPDRAVFSGSDWNPKNRFPDTLFNEMKLEEGQVGIVSGITWTDRDGEMRSHPMVMVFNTRG